MDRAICFTRREFAEVVDVPEVGAPGPREVAGRTLCTLVSPGTELAANYTAENFPSFSGYASVFVVEEVGSEAEGFEPGQIVFGRGGHRSRQKLATNGVARVPDGLAPDVASLARLMGVSMTTLVTTAARPGDTVVISGLGPVGYLAAHVFHRAGYDVVAVDVDQDRRRSASESGLLRIYDRIPLDGPEAVADATLVVDCSGHEQAVLDGCRCVQPRGEVVLVGVPWVRRTDLLAHDILNAVFHKYAVLRSGWEWEIPENEARFAARSLQKNYRTALEWLSEGVIPVGDRLVRHSPQEAQAVYSGLLARTQPGLFHVFDWRD